MRNDRIMRPGITPPRVVHNAAALSEHVPHCTELGVEQHEVARKATSNLLHGLQRTNDIILTRSALPHAHGPLSQLKEHPQDQGRITDREHNRDPATHEGELTARRPKARANIILQLLQSANPVLGVARRKIVPGPRREASAWRRAVPPHRRAGRVCAGRRTAPTAGAARRRAFVPSGRLPPAHALAVTPSGSARRSPNPRVGHAEEEAAPREKRNSERSKTRKKFEPNTYVAHFR